MNRTITDLADICRKNRLAEKLLFVPSHTVGHQIGQWLAKSGTSWVNLRVTTAAMFAAEVTSVELSRTGRRFIESDERLAVVEEICRMDGGGVDSEGYFRKAGSVVGLRKALSNTLHELRMAGIGPGNMSARSFLVTAKGEELRDLLTAYEDVLEKRKLVDHAGLLSLATAMIEKSTRPERMVMVLSDFPVTSLERALIGAASGDGLIVLRHDRPAGSTEPSRFFALGKEERRSGEKPEADSGLLKWILDPQGAPPVRNDGTVALFHALGESNEIREVFRRILASGAPVDDVELVIPGVDPYGPLVRDVAASLDLPVTFASGIPVGATRPGSALVLYLKWQVEEFAEKHLRHLLAGGYIELDLPEGGESLSARQAAPLLREAQIGWGRERYALRLRSLAESYAVSAVEWRAEGEDEKASWAEGTEKKIRRLQGWIEGILEATVKTGEEAGETVSRAAFYDGCLSFVETRCRVGGELDDAARSGLIDLLRSLRSGPSLSDPLPALAEGLTETIAGLSVGYSGPKPGALHVADYRSAGWSSRGRTFIVGLDQARFPGPQLQDPIILDEEREKLGAGMVQSGERLKEKVYLMAKVLASAGGHITISYPCRDLLDDRVLLPASLVLNAYRLVAGHPSADYSELVRYLGEPVGFIPDRASQPLNEWEWWLSRGKSGGYDQSSVLDCYPNLRQGRIAEEARTTGAMTHYDGHAPSAAKVFAPYEKKRVLSPSQLESLATCPFRFFMTYLLHVEPLEDLEKDPGRWLDGAQRGTLLHDVFRRFMEHLAGKGERPGREAHWSYLKELALEEVGKWKEVIPPPSNFAFDREVREVLQTCETFLRDEEERCRTVEPCFFELSFGVKGEGGPGTHEPVEIAIEGKGSFLLRGRIDRVDRCGEHRYEVWDYKTGSSYGYKEGDYFRNGRQIQHVLYSVAAETLLRRRHDKKASVVRGGYYFPGPKGEGLRIERNETRRGEAFEILDDLFTLLTTGAFPSAHDTDACAFCSHSPACGGGETVVARCRELLSGSDELLEPLRRLLKGD